MALRQRPKLTYDDYVLFPDDERRRELIDGEVYVTPSPSVRHQDIVRVLLRKLDSHLETHGGGRVFVAPLDVLLSEVDVVQPDIVFVADDRTSIIGEENLKGAPSLAVEVLSDPARDRRLKRDLYARYGVLEYWVVDPDAHRIEVFRTTEQGYDRPEILEPGDTLNSALIPGFELDVADAVRR